MSTIYALATPRGKAGLGVVRVSGPGAHAAAGRLTGPLPSPRRAALRRMRAADGTVIDEALVVLFPEGASYTGEPVAELQCHGSPAVIDAVLAALSECPGLRPAEAGEFTRRALENDRLDLTQVEGLADLIDAETELQRRQAWSRFDGAAGQAVDEWRRDLLRAQALLEASIDFVDDEVPDDVWPEVVACVSRVRSAIEAQLDGIAISERLRDGFEVAVVGPPNVGKSSLINILARRDAAIVSSRPGTTRDVLEVRMDLAGLPVTFLDTAGLRETSDEIERMGIARAIERSARADLRVILLEGPGACPRPRPRPGDIVVLSRADLFAARTGVSSLTGDGVGDLVDLVANRLRNRLPESSTFVRHRHRRTLTDAAGVLRRIEDDAFRAPPEIAATMLWDTTQRLGGILGGIGVEDVLAEIFQSFCIGK